ncbi:MAG: hypothetical protein KDB16_06290 [Acidimicrobiales bacterium]|nr:hypothetical protein [Acidimicrobiales bacterium]
MSSAKPSAQEHAWRSVRTVVAEAAAVAILTSIVAAVVLGFFSNGIGRPLHYSGDELAGLGHVVGVDESGWWFENERLGAPYELEAYDFPQGGDGLQVLFVRIIGLAGDNPAAIMNLYFLATFALVAFVSHLVMRYLGLGPLVAGAASLLYALIPFHFWHGTPHIYRSGYFAVPLGGLVLLWVGGFRGGYFKRRDSRPGGSHRQIIRRDRVAVTALAIALIATTDTVAAAFAPSLAATIGILALLRTRDWRPLAVALAFGVAVVGSVTLANIGSLLYQADRGPNEQTVKRDIGEQEVYALKLSRVVLPSEEHRIEALAEYGRKPLESRIQSEGGQALGLIGVVGLVASLLALIPFTRSGIGNSSEDEADTPELDRLLALSGTINLIAILLAVPGGLAFLLTISGFEEIRTWNRIIVYVAFFSFVSVGVVLTKMATIVGRRSQARAVPAALLAAVVAFAIFDQTPAASGRAEDIKSQWETDSQFFGQVEASLATDPDPMLYTLPLVPYPEPDRATYPIDYQHMRAILQTERLEVSYGAMRGRPESLWQLQLERLPVDVAVDVLAAIGFDGIYADTWALPDAGVRLDSIMPVERGLELGRNRNYPIGDRLGTLTDQIGPDRVAALASENLRSVDIELGTGFHTPGRFGRAGSFAEDAAVIHLEPLYDEAAQVTLVLDLLTAPGAGRRVDVEVGGEVVATSLSADDRSVHFEVPLMVGPEGLDVRLLTDSPEFQAPGDARRIQLALNGALALGPTTHELYGLVNPDRLALTLGG